VNLEIKLFIELVWFTLGSFFLISANKTKADGFLQHYLDTSNVDTSDISSDEEPFPTTSKSIGKRKRKTLRHSDFSYGKETLGAEDGVVASKKKPLPPPPTVEYTIHVVGDGTHAEDRHSGHNGIENPEIPRTPLPLQSSSLFPVTPTQSQTQGTGKPFYIFGVNNFKSIDWVYFRV
jgi:hypothetical protein